jgi:hypothetical protein
LAVKIGYKNVYRFAEGLPKWKEMGLRSSKARLPIDQKQGGMSPAFGAGLFLTLLGVFRGIAQSYAVRISSHPDHCIVFGGRSEAGGRQGYLILHGVLYILGLSVMNSALGISAALQAS